MKKIVFYISCLAVFSSCNSVIELTPLAENSVDNFYKTESDLDQAVVAVYDGLQGLMRPGFLDHFAEVRSDNTYNFATTPGGGVYADFDNFNLTSDNARLNAFWNAAYQTIQRANIVLNRIDAVPMDAGKIARRKGEVRFVRSLVYFYLVQIWGDVPLVLAETTDPMEFIGKGADPKSEVYAQLIKELEQAAGELAGGEAWGADGRVDEYAAYALLARVSLVQKAYDRVLENVDKVINSGRYALDNNYNNIFNYHSDSKEVIFKVQFKSGTNSEGFPFLNVNHDYNNTASRDFMETFKDDPRLQMNVAPTGINTYYSKKLHNESVATDNTINIRLVVLRYADVLLMKAEALANQGYPNAEAVGLVNQVRERVGALPLYVAGDFSSKDDFLMSLLDERRIELAFENMRWFDLLRTGKALEVMSEKRFGGDRNNSASALPFEISEKDLLFPIPQAQIDASANALKQNPGYGS